VAAFWFLTLFTILEGSGDRGSGIKDIDSKEVGDESHDGVGSSNDGETNESSSDTISGGFGFGFVSTGGDPFNTTPNEEGEDENTSNDEGERNNRGDESTDIGNLHSCWLRNTDSTFGVDLGNQGHIFLNF